MDPPTTVPHPSPSGSRDAAVPLSAVPAKIAEVHASSELLELALGVSGLGVWEWDIATDRETWSSEQLRLFGFSPNADENVGSVETFLSLLHPDDREPVREELHRAIESGEGQIEGEFRILRRDTGELRWFSGRARVYPDPKTGRAARIVGVNGDVTERKRAEERRQFLAGLFDRTRHLLDENMLVAETVRSVGPFLGLTRYLYVEMAPDADEVQIRDEWRTPDAPTLPARQTLWHPERETQIRAELAHGRTIVSPRRSPTASLPSAESAAEPMDAAYHQLCDEMGAQAHITVPLLRDGRLTAFFAAHMNADRDWQGDEIALLETVAQQMWLNFEKARLYAVARLEQERFHALTRASGQVIWRTGPDGHLQDAREWGTYTGQTAAQMRGGGWLNALHAEDQPRVAAIWQSAVETQALFACEYRLRGSDGTYRWFSARGIPLFHADGSLREHIGALVDIDARREVEAAQARTLAEQQRIAATLQRSLLLTASETTLPGIGVSTVYEPALDEAQIGGDFYDVFALDSDDGLGAAAALVVGDVSGKGLEAAAYTAEVKYALRALLRESPNPAIAMERLNNFLIDSRRLDRRGIGTLVSLAVIVIHPARNEAFAAVAGAEPPLIARASGELWPVPVAGLMLGVEARTDYDGVRFSFGPGDLLALTTDGLTEARDPARRTFFGEQGVADALRAALPLTELPLIGGAVVGAAKRYAGGHLHDDVCLLLARRG